MLTLQSWRVAARAALIGAIVTTQLAAQGAPPATKAVTPAASVPGRVTSPKAFFGKNVGDDYTLFTYDQFLAYWKRMDTESPRMQAIEIGKTGDGRPHMAAIITAPENFARLARYKQISQQMHSGRIDSAAARALAREGKSVVWIDGGLHATETVGAHQLIETVYQLVSRNDAETQRILRDVIVVAVHANPDGMQLVSSYYMRPTVETERTVTSGTRLYERYAGHDNNRDFFMANLPETQNMNKLLYWEWLPQIMYNHHQSGPAGTVIFAPPFRDPFNYNIDPMVVIGINAVGAAMHQRFLQEGKPGFTMRSGANYSTWWNGGARTTTYFQNVIGLLTEIIGSPTPSAIPFTQSQILPRGDLPAPIEPQPWKFRQSIDYSVTANYGVLDYAQRYKDELLYNMWRMGRNQIERGTRDHWTISNEDMTRLQAARGGGAGAAGGGGRAGGGGNANLYNSVLKDPAHRDPRAYVIPANQPDPATATKFVNILRYTGVEVSRVTAPLTVNGKTYPVGSYVINANQAGRAQVRDMMEPQDHPNDFAYPGGPPVRPYDIAGWTPAYTMGVHFDRIMDRNVTGPIAPIAELAKPEPGVIRPPSGAPMGYLLSPEQNDAFTTVNRVLKANGDVYRLTTPMTANGKTYGVGAFYVTANATTTPLVMTAARDLGVSGDATNAAVSANATKIAPRRIALWDAPNGGMPSGWTRLVLERFEFPFDVACGGATDTPEFMAKYKVIILPDGTGGGGGGGGGRGGGRGAAADSGGGGAAGRGGRGGADSAAAGGRGGGGRGAGGAAPQGPIPGLESYCTVNGPGTPDFKKFVENGGTVVASGAASASLGQALGLQLTNHLMRSNGSALPQDSIFIPGSVLKVKVDPSSIALAGVHGDSLRILYSNDEVFKVAGPMPAGAKTLLWFDSETPLRSGWAWGQKYLNGGAIGFEINAGTGKAFLFTPDITFRAQPHNAFKLVFNGIYAK